MQAWQWSGLKWAPFFQLRLPLLRSLCQADIKVASPSSMFKPRGFHPSISWTRHGAHPSTREVEAKRTGIKVILSSIVRPSFLRHGNLFRWLSDCKRTWMLGPRTQGYHWLSSWASLSCGRFWFWRGGWDKIGSRYHVPLFLSSSHVWPVNM